MKKLSLITMLVCGALVVNAQGTHVSKFFEKYSSDESFTIVNVSGKMFSLFSNIELDDDENQELVNAMSKLKGLRILAKEKTLNGRKLYAELIEGLPKKNYEEIMTVREKLSDIKFFISEGKPGVINELVMVSVGSEDFMALSLFGEIDLKQMSKLGSSLDIDGLNKLEKLHDKN